MTRNITLMAILGLLLISFSALAQRTTTINERVQQTYVNAYSVNVAGWLRVHPSDVFETEVRNLYIRGTSFVTNSGNMEVYVNGRLISRVAFGRIPTEAPISFPIGTRLNMITIRVNGEVYVESVRAVVIERYYRPVPPPMPPRPAPIPPRPAPIPPRPVPPRHAPAPRPTPPRHAPAPRPTPPRHEPAPRPGNPRPGQPAPRPGNPRPGNPGPGPRR